MKKVAIGFGVLSALVLGFHLFCYAAIVFMEIYRPTEAAL
jgi:hypothetical protein